MDRKAGIARFLAEDTYAKAVHHRFHELCEETAQLDALTRCRALNHLLETEVRFYWVCVQVCWDRHADAALV